MNTKHHCVSLHIFHTIRKNLDTHSKCSHGSKGGCFCHYCWFFGFFAFTFFFCPFFFFVRTAFSPINAFLEEKVTFCLGLLAFFKLGFELGCFSFSLLTERMTLSFLPISSELFNFKARWTASVFCNNNNNNKAICNEISKVWVQWYTKLAAEGFYSVVSAALREPPLLRSHSGHLPKR